MTARRCLRVVSWSITPPFGGLSSSPGYVAHALLTLPPRYSPPEGDFGARLAWVSHAASVRSEPGSNPSLDIRSNPTTSSAPKSRARRPIGPRSTQSLTLAVSRRSGIAKTQNPGFGWLRSSRGFRVRDASQGRRPWCADRPGSAAVTADGRPGHTLVTDPLFTCQRARSGGASSPHRQHCNSTPRLGRVKGFLRDADFSRGHGPPRAGPAGPGCRRRFPCDPGCAGSLSLIIVSVRRLFVKSPEEITQKKPAPAWELRGPLAGRCPARAMSK